MIIGFRSLCCNVQLGCGTALPGILAAKLGAKVTLSDSKDLPLCLQQAKQSCSANSLTNEVDVIGITWGAYNPTLLNLSPVDIILGSDCFYDTKGNRLFFFTCHLIYITKQFSCAVTSTATTFLLPAYQIITELWKSKYIL